MRQRFYIWELKELAKHRFKTFIDIEEHAGISRNTLYRLTTEDWKKARLDTIKRLAEYLKVEYDRDDQGIYFYIPEKEESSDRVNDVSEGYHHNKLYSRWMQKLIDIYPNLDPETKTLLDGIVKQMFPDDKY